MLTALRYSRVWDHCVHQKLSLERLTSYSEKKDNTSAIVTLICCYRQIESKQQNSNPLHKRNQNKISHPCWFVDDWKLLYIYIKKQVISARKVIEFTQMTEFNGTSWTKYNRNQWCEYSIHGVILMECEKYPSTKILNLRPSWMKSLSCAAWIS